MNVGHKLRARAARALNRVPAQLSGLLLQVPSVLHVGLRGYTRRVGRDGARAKKVFTLTPAGRRAFATERLAARLFESYDWMPRWHASGVNWFERDHYPEDCRLDRVAGSSTLEQRRELMAACLFAALDLYAEGYCHRDLHARNVFVVNGSLTLIDFETLAPLSPGYASFLQSYDVTGRGMPSPLLTSNIGIGVTHDGKTSISEALGVTVEEGRESLIKQLKASLRSASLTFQNAAERIRCASARIYSTFNQPGFVVTHDEAQRDCARRYDRFGLSPAAFAEGTVLDLGSNIGGMLLEAQRFGPRYSLGIEYDDAKVRVARKLAAFCGQRKVEFRRGDIDLLSPADVGGQYDIVMALAIDAHVQDKMRLYQLLGKLTTRTLLFEGNAGTDVDGVIRELTRAGFRRVDHLGFCDDDALETNNVRPLFVAGK